MSQLTDPSVLEESQDYEHEPASVFTRFSHKATTLMPTPSPIPNAVISDSGVVTSSFQFVYLLISVNKLANANDLDRSEHGRLCLGAVPQRGLRR